MDRDTLLKTTKMLTASHFQVAIFEEIYNQMDAYLRGEETQSIHVGAVAGSGKTTTIVAGANILSALPKNVKAIFLAFNRDIAQELGARLPAGIEAKTLNALGHGIWTRFARAANGVQQIQLDAKKTYNIMKVLFSREEIRNYFADVKFVVSMCKSQGIVPASVTDCVGVSDLTDSDYDLQTLCLHHRHFIDAAVRPTVFRMAREVLVASLKQETVIDFDDQKYMTVVKRPAGRKIATMKYDMVMVDEVQDVNAVDMALINMIRQDRAPVIGVGDKFQAIYGFRGADTNAVDNFCETFNAKTLPLSLTYRCGKSLVAHAAELVPTIQAPDTAVEGEVKYYSEYTAKLFQADDLVMCRNNAPLIRLAYKLIAQEVPVYLKGRDIGRSLIALITALVGVKSRSSGDVDYSRSTVVELNAKLSQWLVNKTEEILAADADDFQGVAVVQDQHDTLKTFMDMTVDNKVTTVVANIEKMFNTNATGDENNLAKGRVVLSSVHKAKGLEADRAFILDYGTTFFPKYVKPDTWQYQQEKNVDYVARTRGKTHYGYINLDSYKLPEQATQD